MKCKIVSLILLLTAFPLAAMKRKSPESEEQRLPKVQTVQAVQSRLQIPPALEYLPKDLKATILAFLTTAPGVTRLDRLEASVNNIRNFMTLNKAFNNFLNDTKLNEFLVRELAKNYIADDPDVVTDEDLEEAVVALRTPGAAQWLIDASGILKLPGQEQPLQQFAGVGLPPGAPIISIKPQGEPLNSLEKAIIKYFFMAYEERDLEKVRFYLKTMPTLLWAKNQTYLNNAIGRSFLLHAIMQRDTELIALAYNSLHKLLNEKKISVPPSSILELFRINDAHQNALAAAAYSGNVQLFDFINHWMNIERNSLIERFKGQKDREQINTAFNAVRLIKSSTDEFSGDNVLINAVKSNNMAMVDRLLALPEGSQLVNVSAQRIRLDFLTNQQTAVRIFPLQAAIADNNFAMIKRLLNVPGIDVNVQNDRGETPLFTAVNNAKAYATNFAIFQRSDAKHELESSLEIVRLLLKNPTIKVNLANKEGRTPLSLVQELPNLPPQPGMMVIPENENVRIAKEAIVKLLKEHGAE